MDNIFVYGVHVHNLDVERLHVLTKNRKTKTGIDFSESDTNLINTKFNLT